MRFLLIISAIFHAAMYLLAFFTPVADVLVASAVAVVVALTTGGILLTRNGEFAGVWLGTMASLTAFLGWASNLVLWLLERDRGGEVDYLIGLYLPPVAVIVYLIAAFLVEGTHRRRSRSD